MFKYNDYNHNVNASDIFSSRTLIPVSACDQILLTRDYTILKDTTIFVAMTEAFSGRDIGEIFPVV